MSYETIRVSPVTANVGAEIEGVDLSRPLGNRQFQEVHDALVQCQVIFFRDQNLSPEAQKDFGRRFGPLHIHPATPNVLPDHPEVMLIHADENSKHVAGEAWHSDVSCDEEPPLGSILYMMEVPPAGGDTLFASMYAAYEALSEPMKRFLEGLTAIHDGEQIYRGRYGNDDRAKVYPRAEHPVIRTHPVSGRRALYVNRIFTTRIKELSKVESDGLLEVLFRHAEDPIFQCRFKWQVGSVAFWDNRCVQHLAVWDYYPNRRHGHRVTVKGDRPFFRA